MPIFNTQSAIHLKKNEFGSFQSNDLDSLEIGVFEANSSAPDYCKMQLIEFGILGINRCI
jgi:hypothetical protein